ncbi:MAG: hypothetical protein ACPG46_06305 [Thalassotalea sp.]
MSNAIFIKGLILTLLMGSLNVQAQNADQATQQQHNLWLKEKFAQQHESLIPVVAVADMFYACNKKRKVDPIGYQVKELIIKMNRDVLATKLADCLNGETVKSETALNFGLIGCFHEQLQDLPKTERQQKMILVGRAIASLTYQERQKSFTQCVTDQAIGYLK